MKLFLTLIFLGLISFSYAQPNVYKQAVGLAKKGTPQKGLELLQSALESDAQNIDLMYYTGLFLEKLRNPTQATTLYKQVLAKENNHYDANYRLGLIYERKGEVDVAMKYYQAALTNVSQAERNAVMSKVFLLVNSKIKSKEGISDELKAHVKKEAIHYYENEPLERMSPSLMLALASFFYNTSEYQKAKSITGKILEKVKNNSQPVQKAAVIYSQSAFRLQDFESMNMYIGRVKNKEMRAALENTASDYYYNLGYAYFFTHDKDKCLRYLRTALTIKANYIPAQVFINQLEGREADKSLFIDRLRSKSDNSKKRDGAYYADLTRLYVDQKRYKQAVSAADSCLMIERNKEEIYYLKGIALYKQLKYKKGIQVLMQGIKRFPKMEEEVNAKYYFLMAILYKRLHEVATAEKTFQRAKKSMFKDAAEWELRKIKD